MLEHLLTNGKTKPDDNVTPDAFTFLGESSAVGTYAEISTACGMTTGTLMANGPLLSFKPNDRDEIWYVPKTVIRHTFALNLPASLGISKGNDVVINGVTYFVRLIKAATGPVVSANLGSAYNYVAGDEFNNSEFNKMFYPILGLAGSSVEGMPYGTQAQYTQVQLGFSPSGGTAQASLMQEQNSQGVNHLLVQGQTTLRGRFIRAATATSSTGWRPLLIKRN